MCGGCGTNSVGPLTSALSALQGKGPFFGIVPGITVPWVNQNNVAPYAQQWGVTFQFQLDPRTMLQLSYNGHKGTHLITNFAPALNYPDIGNLKSLVKQGYNFNATVPNPFVHH